LKDKIRELDMKAELLFINIFCVFLGTNKGDEVQQASHFTPVNQFHFYTCGNDEFGHM
jgi:hypothetical protein